MTSPGFQRSPDRMVCLCCGGLGIAANSVSRQVTERTLQLIGWRNIQGYGWVCPDCRGATHTPLAHRQRGERA